LRNYDDLDTRTSFPGQSSVQQQPGLQQMLRIFARRRRLILGTALACLLIAVLITVFMTPTYSATATIELNKNASTSMDVSDILSSQLGSDTDLNTDLQTEIAILQGDSLALAVIEKLGLQQQTPFKPTAREARKMAGEQDLPLERAPITRGHLLGVFQKHLKVELIHGTRLIQMTVQTHDPEQAAEIANASIEAYKSQYLQTHYDATTETSGWLASQLSDLKKNVEVAERKLTDFQKATGILSLNMMMPATGANAGGGDAGAIHSVVLEKLDALNAELTIAEGNRIEKEAIYRLTKTGNLDIIMGLSSDPLAVQAKSAVLTNGEGLSNLMLLRQQKGQIEVSFAQASKIYGQDNRHLKDLQTQIDSVDAQIHQELLEIIKRAEADFQLSKDAEAGVRKEFEKQKTSASDLNEQAVTLALLTEEAFSSKRLYEDLYTKLQEANVSAGIKATNITVVDKARAAAVPVEPKPLIFIPAGLLIGLFIGVVIAFTLESLDRTISNPTEVEQITGMQVIGTIPYFDAKERQPRYGGAPRPLAEDVATNGGKEGPWILRYPESAGAEAFRSLRTSILLSKAGGSKTILVTSSVPSEGKTTIIGNLAVAFAQNNKKVILIEADMRRPRIEHVVGVTKRLGLSNVLAGICSLEEATEYGVHVPTLDVMLAGPRPPLPSELLQSSSFDALLHELQQRYDFLLIDSPPALLLDDAVAIAPKVDAVIWVARAGFSTKQFLSRAAQVVLRNHMPGIGIVLNGINLKDEAYGYTYGYSQYGAYYMKEGPREDR
jgi:succinoglycan biosynthesis transport protein ExoP